MLLKRIQFLLCLLVGCLCLAEDIHARYYVHKVSGDVSCLRGDTYVQVTKGEALNVKDAVKIGDKGLLSIVDRSTSRVYICDEEGLTTVANVILAARKQSDAVTRLAYKQAMASVKDGPKNLTTVGSTVRGDESQMDTTQLLYKSICAELASDDIELSDSVSLSRVTKDDQWYFRVTNSSTSLLYFGIIRKEGDKYGIMLDVGRFDGVSLLAIEPDTVMDLEQFLFVDSEKTVSYVLFATSAVFDTQELNLLLKSRHSSSDTQSELPLIYAVSQ